MYIGKIPQPEKVVKAFLILGILIMIIGLFIPIDSYSIVYEQNETANDLKSYEYTNMTLDQRQSIDESIARGEVKMEGSTGIQTSFVVYQKEEAYVFTIEKKQSTRFAVVIIGLLMSAISYFYLERLKEIKDGDTEESEGDEWKYDGGDESQK